MSGYADTHKDLKQAAFIAKWCPEAEGNGLPEINEENLRWNIARARAAETKLHHVMSALDVLKGFS